MSTVSFLGIAQIVKYVYFVYLTFLYRCDNVLYMMNF